MTKAAKRRRIQKLRDEANDLDGMFNLYDYCDNGTRESWSQQADKLRAKADRLAERIRARRGK